MYHKVAFWVSVVAAVIGVIVASVGVWWGILQAIICAVLAYSAYSAKRRGEPAPLSKEWHEKEKREWREKVGIGIVKCDGEEGAQIFAQARENLKSQGIVPTGENIKKEALRILLDKDNNEAENLVNR